MALTKETVVDKIEVLESNAIQVRSAIRVLEDGEVLSSSYHRHVRSPLLYCAWLNHLEFPDGCRMV
jgi:hypothetical protein